MRKEKRRERTRFPSPPHPGVLRTVRPGYRALLKEWHSLQSYPFRLWRGCTEPKEYFLLSWQVLHRSATGFTASYPMLNSGIRGVEVP